MNDTEGGYVWVCVDCYFAHHFGRHLHEGKWYSGVFDIPCDREPLGLWNDQSADLWDATCSDHDGDDDTPCTYCKRAETDNGVQGFSWSRCEGCGSRLRGARFRLHWTERTAT